MRRRACSFSLDLLVRLAARAGLKPQRRLVAQVAGACWRLVARMEGVLAGFL